MGHAVRRLPHRYGSAEHLVSTVVLAQDVFIYPQKGQSEEQQSKDRFECHTWPVQQAQDRADYDRALSACLEGRGYTVK